MNNQVCLHSAIKIAFNALYGRKVTEQVKEADTLLKCAEKQNIYPHVYYGVGELCFTEKEYKTTIRQIGAVYYVRKMAHLDVVRQMENSGIRTILLKGYSCSQNYAKEYLRLSTDCDLLISETNEDAAIRILEKNKYKCIIMRQKNQHHSVWKHEDTGILELHTKLVEEDVDYIWERVFDEEQLIEKRIRIESPEGCFYKLPPVEEWVFLFVHTLKHFLQTGISVQMLFDLYSVYNILEETNAQIALEIIDKSAYGKLWNVFYSYVQKYGKGVEPDVDDEAIEIITQDLLNSGWIGLVENTNRISLFDVSKKRELTLKNWAYRAATIFRRAFPEKKIMESRYPILKGKPWKLPIVYLKRFAGKTVEHMKPSKKALIEAKIHKVAKSERIRMIERIIELSK